MTTLSDKAGFLIAANFVKYAVGFIMPMMLVRMLTKAEYGTLQQVQLLGTLSLNLLVLGLPSSVYYFYRHDEGVRRMALVQQTTWMLLASGAVTATCLVLAASAFARWSNNPAVAVYLPIFAISVGLGIAGEHFVPLMIAQNRYATAVTFETGEAIARVSLLVLPLLAGYGLPGLIWAIVGVALARCLLRECWLLKDIGWQVRPVRGTYFVGEQLKYSLPILLTGMAGVVGAELDRLLIATNFTPSEYAIYTVGALNIPLDTIFQTAVANVLRASLPALVRAGQLAEISRLLCEASRKLSIVVVPTFVFLYGFSQEFMVLLFTRNYADSVAVFRIYLLFLPLSILILSPIPQAFGKTKASMYLVFGVTVLHALLSLFLLNWVGYLGPAISGVISSYVLAILYLRLSARLVNQPWYQLLPLLALARSTGAALVALVIARFLCSGTEITMTGFAIAAGLFTISSFGTAVALGVFTAQDRALALRWMRRFGLARP